MESHLHPTLFSLSVYEKGYRHGRVDTLGIYKRNDVGSVPWRGRTYVLSELTLPSLIHDI